MTARDRYLRRTYGISEDDYERMARNGCMLCGRRGKTRALHVDHDHVSGRVRGVLCWRHNRAIEMFNDDPALLERAAAYLRGEIT